MARPIKFRAWDRKHQLMFDVQKLEWNDGVLYAHDGEPEYGARDDIELMQYTGLRDKNGTPIFEGDILEGSFTWGDDYGNPVGDPEVERAVVKWGEASGTRWTGFGAGNMNYGEYPLEVIGNVWQNKELLEQKEAA